MSSWPAAHLPFGHDIAWIITLVEIVGTVAVVAAAGILKVHTSMTLESNKTTVRAFYDLAFNQQKPAEAASRYIGPSYRQHNPMAPDGPEPFVEFVTGLVRTFPKLRVDFKRMVAEGDLVVSHSHFVRQPGDRGMAVMDIFRLEGGKLVEHWDVLQEIPEQSANANTMF